MTPFSRRISQATGLLCALLLLFSIGAEAQEPQEKLRDKQVKPAQEKSAEPPNAAQIELLETKYRFESNGDSRKEVHALVKINSELGVRQFARLNFDYNRAFQSVEIPLAHITHANGGTSDILPSAITDAPNPAVEKFPAYHDVRVKSVRILGLQPGDSLEYRVVTTTTKHPLAPDFWLDHYFDRSSVVSTETFEVDMPTGGVRVEINPQTPASGVDKQGARTVYRWKLSAREIAERETPDVAITTLPSWEVLARKLEGHLRSTQASASIARKKAAELLGSDTSLEHRVRLSYEFISGKIATVDVPLGATGFQPRTPDAILGSGYATPEDKYVLLHSFVPETVSAMSGEMRRLSELLPRPSLLSKLVVVTLLADMRECEDCASHVWLDPAIEVAPFGVLPHAVRGNEALCDAKELFGVSQVFLRAPQFLPFESVQHVAVSGSLASDGVLSARVKYRLRGDNELLLRVTFHHTPMEKQREIAQYLALSDGFRGKVTSVKTSDPYDTDKPFEVEYELTQEKFVDWSKKPVRIPALLPLPGLPETPKKSGDAKIDLGPPLNIELTGTLRLPAGTTAQAPAGTSVKRDYATFTSEYSSNANLLHFSRHLNFLSSELPADRDVDLSAFIHAVQSDQSQLFVLDKPDSVPPAKPK